MSRTADTALGHRNYGLLITDRTVQRARSLWQRINPLRVEDSFWRDVHPGLVEEITEAQRLMASLADDYVERVTGVEPVAELDPEMFSGIAADGRELESLLAVPLDDAREALESDVEPLEALAQGQDTLERITGTEVPDAGRTADQVAAVARPEVDRYVRTLVLPSCDRCVVLAGQTYKIMQPFQRHPGCDCRHTPIVEGQTIPSDVTTDPTDAIRSGKVHGLSQADTQAILDGADPSQVLNAKQRGAYTAADGSKATTEGTGKTGLIRGKPRLRPEAIYRQAGDDRAEAIRLLRANRYLA